jgi:hypothetical protein
MIYQIGFTADLYHITIDNINGVEVIHLPINSNIQL